MTTKNNQIKLTILLSAFLLPAVIYSLLLLHYQILPFGQTTLLFSDLDTQYIEFMAEYRRVLLGEGSFTWSWHAGLGMNFIALIAYYLASPFNFLLPIFSENRLPLAVSVITVLKLGCAAMAFAGYLLNLNKKRTEYIPLIAACYALSSYAIGYTFNIMWLDAMIWLPLICTKIDRMLTTRKGMTALTLVLWLSFLSQFYMAWMTGAFALLYFLTQNIRHKCSIQNFLRNLLRFFICVGIAAGMSAFLLLPTFFVLKNNMGLLGQEFPDFSGQYPFLDIFQKLFIGSFDGIKDCLPHVYCGLFVLIGTICYFLHKEISLRNKIISGLVLILLLVSFWFAPLDFLWHAMDHPSWFPFRYAFIFCFWMASLAYEGISTNQADRNPVSSWMSTVLCATGIFIISLLSTKEKNPESILLNCGFLAAYAVLLFSKGRKGKTGILLILISAELFVNGASIMRDFRYSHTNNSDYVSFHEHYRKIMSPRMPQAYEFFRMEKGTYRNYNDALGVGYPGVSHFSSTASTRQSEFLKRLGFNCYATWCTYEGATSATDALLGIRYEFQNFGKQDSIRAGEETWEHPSRFPLFFFTDENFARYDFYRETDAISRQNDLLKLLSGDPETDFFEPYSYRITQVQNLTPDGENDYYKTDPAADAYIEIEVEPAANKSLYLFLPDASLTHTVIINETNELMNGNRDYAPFPICLDPYSGSGTIHIRINAVREKLPGKIEVYVLDTEKIKTLSDKINHSAPQMVKNGNTTFRLTTEPADEERLVVSSIPFDAGWQVHIDGQRKPIKMIHNSMTGFVLPASSDEAIITYHAYGLKEGTILSVCSGILFIIMLWVESPVRKEKQT